MALRDLLIKLKVIADASQLANVDKKLTASKKSTEGLLGSLGDLKNAFLALGAVVVAQQVAAFVNDTIEAASAVYDQAQALGISTDALQTWGVFLGQAGASTEDLQGTFRILAGNMQTVAATGKGPAAEAFKALGVDVDNADGSLRDMTEVLLETGGALAMIENQATRSALATDTLGRGAAKLLPAFEGGTEAARKQLAVLKEIAIVYDKQFIKAADEAGDSLALLKVRFASVKAQMMQGSLPAIKAISEWLGKAVDKIIKLGKETTIFRVAGAALAGILGGALITKLGGFNGIMFKLGRIVGIAARAFMRFLLPALILDDIIGGLQGKQSVFGDVLKGLFGEEDGKQMLVDIRKFFTDDLPGFFKQFEGLAPIAKSAALAAGDAFKAIGSVITAFTGLIRLGFAENADKSEEIAMKFIHDASVITDAMDAAFTAIGEVFHFVWRDIKEFASSVWASIALAFQTHVVDPIKAAANAAWAAIAGAFKAVFVDPVVAAVNLILGAFDKIKNGVGSVVRALNPFSSGSPVGAPKASGALGMSRATTLTDQRIVNINVGGSATPGATGRAVADSVATILTRDRRASMSALGT